MQEAHRRGRKIGFNPRVLAGGRDVHSVEKEADMVFQSTRPRGRTRPITYKRAHIFKVSIHASSREDATGIIGRSSTVSRFQSTRPRGRTRHLAILKSAPAGVSIHASSREDATLRRRHTRHTYRFQSTRPRGRTRPRIVTVSGVEPSFNPRVLAGGRDQACPLCPTGPTVSIHASSREDATNVVLYP